MIYFERLLAGRLDVQLRELTIGEAVKLAAMPPGRHELATTALLRMVVEPSSKGGDPAGWTVQERMQVVVHFLAGMGAFGDDFMVAGQPLSSYMTPENDTAPSEVNVGEACGSEWVVRQLIGAEAEWLETMCRSRFDWLAGDMAARMRAVGDPEDDAAPSALAEPARYAEWLASRIAVFRAMPQSDFCALAMAYDAGMAELDHLFALSFDDEGFVALPVKGGDARGASVRFPVAAAVCDLAHSLGPRPAEPSRDDVHVGRGELPRGNGDAHQPIDGVP